MIRQQLAHRLKQYVATHRYRLPTRVEACVFLRMKEGVTAHVPRLIAWNLVAFGTIDVTCVDGCRHSIAVEDLEAFTKGLRKKGERGYIGVLERIAKRIAPRI